MLFRDGAILAPFLFYKGLEFFLWPKTNIKLYIYF